LPRIYSDDYGRNFLELDYDVDEQFEQLDNLKLCRLLGDFHATEV